MRNLGLSLLLLLTAFTMLECGGKTPLPKGPPPEYEEEPEPDSGAPTPPPPLEGAPPAHDGGQG